MFAFLEEVQISVYAWAAKIPGYDAGLYTILYFLTVSSLWLLQHAQSDLELHCPYILFSRFLVTYHKYPTVD